MPRDQRLYMTFPIDFWTHPKVARLSDAAFRAFVEANGHSRMRETDGVLEVEDAEFLWASEALLELVRSHPTRPLMVRDGETYVLRDYAEHQFTKADRDALTEKRREAGRLGGKAKASAKQVPSKVKQTEAESESGIDGLNHVLQSQSLDTRASVSTDAIPITETTRRLAAQKGIHNLRSVVDAIQRHTGITTTADQAFQLSVLLLERAKTWPHNPQPYVLKCIRSSPHEIAQHLYERIGVS